MGGALPAALFLARARRDSAMRAEGQFPPFRFVFRGTDVSAIREVLLDREYAFLRPVLDKLRAPIIIDAGAHIGLFSLWLLSERPETHILSVEADPQTYAILSENVVRSSQRVHSWRAVNRAAWKDNTSVSFTDVGDSMSHRVSGSGGTLVDGISLDELIEMVSPNGEVDLLKVDIEGAEEAFLCSHPDALARVQNLVVELHPTLCNSDRVDALLKSTFRNVEYIGGRVSSKPLLLCRR
jgi:FkbM family methyltransferase